MFDVLVHRLPIEQVIETREIDIAVSSIDLAGADMALSSQIGRERALEKALAPIKDRYDYIFVDTPPSLGLLTINAFVAATGVIVPVQTEYLSLRGLVQLENTLAMVRENLNPRVEIIGIVPTMYDKRITHSREADEILRENFGDLVYNTRIRKTIRFAEAPVKGTSVLAYEPNGEAAEHVPRSREGGARWPEIAPACVKGPLAELFRATEAAQKQSKGGEAQQQLPTEPEQPQPVAAEEPPVSPTPIRAVAPAPDPEPEPERRERPLARWLDPLPEQPARLERARDSASYLAVDPRRRRRRRRPERGRPDDRRRHHAGRLHRGQHRHPAAADERRADQDPHRQRAHRGARLGRRPRDRPPRGRGRLRRDQARAARLGHGLRHRRRGRRHRLRRGARRRAHRARARRAHGRHRHDAVQVRGLPPREAGRGRRRRRCARPATR